LKKIKFYKNQKPFIVAEISGNHCGSKKIFLDHINAAHNCGVDFVKIQTYEPDDITMNTNNKKFKITKGIWKNKSLWNLYKKAQTPYSWHYDAFKLAKKKKIKLFSTPFSVRAVDFLEKFDVPLYKISSLEMNDYNLIARIAKTKKIIIISTGAAKIEEIKKTLKFVNRFHNKIIILHCVSSYPTKIEEANINRISKLQKIFKNNLIGLSDHTDDIYSSLASIPLGCVMIEKHFKLNDKIKSEDATFSLNQNQMKKLVRYRDMIFLSLKGKKNYSNNSLKFIKRSIFANQTIMPGEKITKKNITTLRPKIGLDANKFFDILGKKAKSKIRRLEPIFLKKLK
jgi:pseudaminic acid synthase